MTTTKPMTETMTIRDCRCCDFYRGNSFECIGSAGCRGSDDFTPCASFAPAAESPGQFDPATGEEKIANLESQIVNQPEESATRDSQLAIQETKADQGGGGEGAPRG